MNIVIIIIEAIESNAQVLLKITLSRIFIVLELFNFSNRDPFFKKGKHFILLELFISRYLKGEFGIMYVLDFF